MQDWEALLNFLWFVVLPCAGWAFKAILDLRKDNAAMKVDLANFKAEAANTYAPKTDIEKVFNKIDKFQEAMTTRMDSFQQNITALITNITK